MLINQVNVQQYQDNEEYYNDSVKYTVFEEKVLGCRDFCEAKGFLKFLGCNRLSLSIEIFIC